MRYLIAFILLFSLTPGYSENVPAGKDATTGKVWKIIDVSPTVEKPGTSTPVVVARRVAKVVSDGSFCAWPNLTRWKDAYWLVYSRSKSHGALGAGLVMLSSVDGETWKEINCYPGKNAALLSTPGRLYYYQIRQVEINKYQSFQTFVTYTDDGKSWSEPQPIYQAAFSMWKAYIHNKRFFATAYQKWGSSQRELHLITSADGIQWERVSTISIVEGENETALSFGPDDSIYAVARRKDRRTSILKSLPPYKDWKRQFVSLDISGQNLYTFRDVMYLVSRTGFKGIGSLTAVQTIENGEIHPYCFLPSKGDNGYPEAVEAGDEMLVAYYSSHEGVASIYLAWVPLQLKH